MGRCGECQAWGTVAETGAPATRVAPSAVTAAAVPIGSVSTTESQFRTCGVPELDRVLGGGLVPGAAILLAGEPGVGKSTLLLEVAAQTARYQRRALYLTGEESASQVRLRADRTGGVHDELFVAAETDLGAVLTHVDQVRPELLVIDSVQTVTAADVDGVPGGVSQIKEVAAALIRVAKTRNITTVLVGHVTKDGSIAGPRVLEHLVDVVLHFEGDRNSRFRMVRAMKNRFGPVDEVGCFELAAEGISGVDRPHRAVRREPPAPGARHLRRGRRWRAAVRCWPRCRPWSPPTGRRAPPTHHLGPGLLPRGDGAAQCSSSTARLRLHCPRRVRLDRGRCPALRARRPTWRSRWRSRRPTSAWRRRTGSWRWAKSAWPASCVGSATSRNEWPRPLGWASASRWSPGVGPLGPDARGPVIGCPDIGCTGVVQDRRRHARPRRLRPPLDAAPAAADDRAARPVASPRLTPGPLGGPRPRPETGERPWPATGRTTPCACARLWRRSRPARRCATASSGSCVAAPAP